MFRILHIGDLHLDPRTTELTEAPLEAACEIAERDRPDLTVVPGDLAIRRTHLHPDTAWRLRRAFGRLARASRFGLVVVEGNHDQSFAKGLHGMLAGVAGGADPSRSDDGTVRLITEPTVLHFPGAPVSIVAVPHPHFEYLALAPEQGVTAEGLIQQMIQGLIAAETAKGLDVVVVYHGTITGCTTGSERIMPAGMDVPIPLDAFGGAAAVLLGHIHQRQEIGGGADSILPVATYPGSIAPITWGERDLEPAAYMHGFEPGQKPRRDAIPLPVVAQMRLVEMDTGSALSDVPLLVETEVVAQGVAPGSRCKVKLRARAAAIATLVPELVEAMRDRIGLRELKLVSTRNDDAESRIEVSGAWTMEEAMVAYLDAIDLTEEERGAVLDLTRSVEHQVRDADLDACYSFRPRRLKLVNFCQYSEAEVIFGKLGRITAVTGRNYSGKSNLFGAMIFALYGRQIAGDRTADLVRIGTDATRVELDYDSKESVWRVVRDLKLGSRGATGKTYLYRAAADGEFVPATEGDAAATQDAINRMVGPFELFSTTAFTGQSKVDRFIDMKPSAWKESLQAVLHRDFAGRLRIGRDAAAVQDKARDEVGRRIEEKFQIANQIDPLRERVANLEEMAEQLTAKIATKRGELDTAKLAVSESERAVATARELAAGAGAATERSRAARARHAACQDRLDEARRAGDELVKVGAALAEASAPTKEEIEALDEACRDAQGRAGRARAEAQRLRDGHAVTVDAATTVRLATHQEASARNAAADRAETDLITARRRAELMSRVPCEGKRWRDPEAVPEEGRAIIYTDMATCPLLVDAVAAAGRVPDLERAMDGAKTAAVEAAKAAQAASERFDQAVADQRRVNLESAGTVVEADAEATSAAGAATRARALAMGVADLRAKAAALEATVAGLDGLVEAAAAAAGEVAQADLVVAKAWGSDASLAAALDGLESRSAEVRRLTEEITAMEKVLVDATLQLGSRRSMVEAAEAAADEVKRLVEERAALDRACAAWARYCKAMDRDGIPFLVMERFAIPGLQENANRYLAETDFTINVRGEKEIGSGESRNAVYITFVDHRGEHPLSAASGFQRTAIGMALINGRADLEAQVTGSMIHIAFQDEGFGTADPENLEALKSTVRAIAERRERFIFISHLPAMLDAADSVIEVQDVNGASTVTVR